MLTARASKPAQVVAVKTVPARTVEAATFIYKRHPLLGRRFGPSLVIDAIEVDNDDKFGLDMLHRVRCENRERGGVFVNYLGQVCAAIKQVYGEGVHIKAMIKHRMLVCEFYARPQQQQA